MRDYSENLYRVSAERVKLNTNFNGFNDRELIRI